MALDFGAIAGAAGSILGGIFGGGGGKSDAAEQAAKALWWAQQETGLAGNRANEAYQNAYLTARADLTNALSSYAQTGGRGMTALGNVLAPSGGMTPVDMISGLPPGVGADVTNWLTQTPMYQFPLAEGQKAIERSAAARGMTLSPATLKGLQNYSQNFALTNALGPSMTNYQNYLRNIAGLAGMGQTAATGLGTGLANVAMDTGKLYGSTALQQAAIQAGTAGNLASSYMQQGQQDMAQNYLSGRNTAGIFGGLGSLIGNLPWQQIGNYFGIGGGNSGGYNSLINSPMNW